MIVSHKKTWLPELKFVAPILREILGLEDEFDRSKEHFWAIGLNNRRVIQYIDLVHLGTISSSHACPRDAFRHAVLKGVTHMIVAHNHPSGDETPSKNDREMSKIFVRAGEILEIQILDSFIVTDNSYFSFKENGIF